MVRFTRVYLTGTAICLAASQVYLCGSGAARADPYPSKSIRFLVGFVPGGGGDTGGRVVATKLAEAFSQQVVVDNRGGAGGNIAAELAAKSAPDGYTILESNLGNAISMSLYSKPRYDLLRDFDAVAAHRDPVNEGLYNRRLLRREKSS